MSAHERFQTYFSQLNSISVKITQDVNRVKSAFSRDAWLTLTLNEQEQILNSQLIHPDISTKYYNIYKRDGISGKPQLGKETSKNGEQRSFYSDFIYSFNGQDLHTYIYQNVGLKILHDENIRDCRDEHSFPFSFRSKSQINLPSKEVANISLFKVPIDVTKSAHLKLTTNSPKKQQIGCLQSQVNDDVNQSGNKCNISDKGKKSISIYNNDDYFNSTEQLQLLLTFGSKSSISTDLSDNEIEYKDVCQEENAKLLTPDLQVPKGFDFLSNW